MAAVHCAAAPARPAPPLGTFEVVSARRARAVTSPAALYRDDDPRLVHRIVELMPTRASFDGPTMACPRLAAAKIAHGVVRYRCTGADRHGATWNGAEIFAIGSGRWGLRLIEDYVLVLRRPATPGAAPDAGRTASPTARAIRADASLAGWDKSVREAYVASGVDPADQRAWLSERDRRGVDVRYLRDAMAVRTEWLLSDIGPGDRHPPWTPSP